MADAPAVGALRRLRRDRRRAEKEAAQAERHAAIRSRRRDRRERGEAGAEEKSFEEGEAMSAERIERERISVDELHARFAAQGVAGRDHLAFKCPVCGTVQSIASLRRAAATGSRRVANEATIQNAIGFACEGRYSGAGPWREGDPKRAAVRGCDWTLGGLFKIHTLEVVLANGEICPSFALATPEEAQALELRMAEVS